jgi:hypothetical protein
MMGCYSWYQSNIEIKYTLTSLKMTNNIFTVRNMFYTYKDYNSFLGSKLTVFKLCNYGIVLAKVLCDFLGLF